MSKKSPWFTEIERKILTNLVQKHSSILLSKETSASAIYKKQQTWIKLTREYNDRHPIIRKRLTHQLRRLWGNLLYKKTVSRLERNQVEEKSNDVHNKQNNSSNIDSKEIEEVTNDSRIEEISLLKCNNQSKGNYESLLAPIISSRMKQIEERTAQQREIHLLTVQREKLQIRLLEDQVQKLSDIHLMQINKEKELQELRICQEKSLYHQRIRNEQELHQLKLAEYNRVQAGAYQMIYK